MPEIDNLSIKISSDVKQATQSIDTLVDHLSSLSTSLGNLNTNGLNSLSAGVTTLSRGMQGFNGVKKTDFNRLARGIKSLESIDGNKLKNTSAGLKPLADSIRLFSNTNFDNKNLTAFISSITRLANAPLQGLNNVKFDDLGNNISDFATKLSTASKVPRQTTTLINGIAKLSAVGGKMGEVATALPKLSTPLKELIKTLAGAKSVSENTIGITQGIAQLANAGTKAAATSSALDNLAQRTRAFIEVLADAPAVSNSTVQLVSAIGNIASAGRSANGAFNSIANVGKKNISIFGKLSKGFKSLIPGMGAATSSGKGLASALSKVYATYWLLFRAFGKIRQAIDISSDLTEIQNVVDVTFGDMSYKVEEFAKTSIEQFGMSELTLKQIASRFQAMGTAMNINPSGIASANKYLNEQTAGYVGLSNSMSDVSLNLTKLAADMASFYNVEQADVAEDLSAVFTGMTRPLRQYGLDLTQATLQEWAMKQGIDADVASMSQAEKTMLRYQYVLANTTAAQGDFARTADTWANQTRILRQNLEQLGATLGTAFINMLKPVVSALNQVMSKIISFAETVVNALGKIFGWKLDISNGGIAQDYEEASEGAEDLAGGTGKAAENAKKLKQQLQGFDELNVLTSDNDNGGGGTGGGAGSAGLPSGGAGTGSKFKIEETEGLFKSQIDTLYKLGEYIGSALTKAMNGINWQDVYQGARDFGSGLADFLNGLISPELFGALGTTIAGALNTALYALNSFGTTFDWKDFGLSIATGINNFFSTFDFGLLANTIDAWVDGLKDMLKTAITNVDWKSVIAGIGEFFTEIDVDTLTIAISAIFWSIAGKEMLLSAISNFLSSEMAAGIGTITVSKGAALGISLAVGLIAFKFGNWLYDNVDGIQSISDGIIAWIFKDGDEIAVARSLSVVLGGLSLGLAASQAIKIPAMIAGLFTGGGALSTAATTITTGLTTTVLPALANFFTVTIPGLLSTAFTAITTFLSTFGPAILSALGPIAGIIAAAVGGWNIGQKIYEAITGEEIDMSFTEQIQEIFSAFTDGTIVDAIKMMWSDISDWFSENVITPITNFFQNLANTVSGFFKNLWENIKKVWQTVSGWFGNKVIIPVVNSFTNLKNNIKKAFELAWSLAKGVWSTVSGWFEDNIIIPVVNSFTNLKNNIKKAFELAWTSAKGVWELVSGWFEENIAMPITTKFETVKTNISNAFSNAWSLAKGVWQSVSSWFENNIVTPVKNKFDTLKEKITDAFNKAYTGITTKFGKISDFFKGIASDIFSPIKNAVNGMIKGINWILSKVGSKTQLSLFNETPAFASGSEGLPQDTMGIVNDQKGSTYREMIVPPDGKAFIPKGRNVMLPMKKGTKIMPADETKRFVSNMPHFASGIGNFFSNIATSLKNFTGDILDYIAEPAKAVEIAFGKFVNMNNFGSTIADIAKSSMSIIFDSATSFIKKIFDSTSSAKVEKAIQWALGIAGDNSHGYDQGSRWGNPDYDCSSFVISAFEQAGIGLKSAGATYTGNMLSAALATGFKNIINSVNVGSTSGLKRGDILLNTSHHTGIYLGNGQIVQASQNEKGGITGGTPGDQTGREIFTRGYYNYPWNAVLRYAKFKKGIGDINLADIKGFMSGGFLKPYSLFAAGEGGRVEAIGSVGGKSSVVGSVEITGIRDAVILAHNEEMAVLVEQNDILRGILEKEFGITQEQIGKATQRYSRDYFRRTGKPAFE